MNTSHAIGLHPFCFSALTCLLAAAALASGAPAARAADDPSADHHAKRAFVYIGPYTNGTSRGIYLFRLDRASGKLEAAGVTPSDNPSYVATDPAQRLLFAVGEMDRFKGQKAGSVSAFSRDPATGALSPLNQQSSGGEAPCHLVVDHTGKNLIVANYTGGSVEVLPIEADGRLGRPSDFVQHRGADANPARQKKAHAHGVAMSPDNRFALVADLGLDRVFVYRFDAEHGKISPNDPPWLAAAAGAGPRHLAFHPNGKFVYAINELNSTIALMSYDAAHGRLESRQTISTLPADAKLPKTGTSCAELVVHPSGRFLYGSNRGHDSLAMFSIDQQTGRLTPIGYQSSGGHTPRGFDIDPSGDWLIAANQDSANVVVFRIDRQTGRLIPTGITVEVDKPVCVKILE
ncbi:MAG TPA: lactonase family protein [Pirellulales bacterium]|nr:lactonase family protein [Pirellulales bacterium]